MFISIQSMSGKTDTAKSKIHILEMNNRRVNDKEWYHQKIKMKWNNISSKYTCVIRGCMHAYSATNFAVLRFY